MKINFATAGALLVAIALGYLYLETRGERVARETELAAARAEAERAKAVSADQGPQLSEAELARLKADQAEAAKLRAETAALKENLAGIKSKIDAAKQTATGSGAAPPKKQGAESNPEIRTFNTKVSAHIPAEHGLAIGGWQTSEGKRAFALLVPTMMTAQAGAAPQVQVSAVWVEVSNDIATGLQLDTILSASDGNTTPLPPDFVQEFLKSIETMEGAKIVAAPRVIALAGQEAMVSVTSNLQTAHGPVSIGPEIKVTPTIAADGSGIDLAVDATFKTPAKDSPPN